MLSFGGRALSLPNADLTHNARVSPNGPFAPGDLVMLLDPDGKSFLVRLNEQDSLHHHKGAVRLIDLIGQAEGTLIRSTRGACSPPCGRACWTTSWRCRVRAESSTPKTPPIS